ARRLARAAHGALLAPGLAIAGRGGADLDLAADLEPGSRVERAARPGTDGAHPDTRGADRDIEAGRVVDHELGPQCAVLAVPGGLAGFAQRGQAGLLRASGGLPEPGKLEDDPGAVFHFLQAQRQVLAAGLDPDFGAAADGGLPGVLPPPAVAAE